MIDLVHDRINKPDCKLNGWILDGCPFSHEQIKLLRDLKIEPQKVIAFETSDEKVFEELSSIKIHEQSGKQFSPEEAATVDQEIRSQLVEPNIARVKEEVAEYREFLEATEAEYS